MMLPWADEAKDWLGIATPEVQVFTSGKTLIDPDAAYYVTSFNLVNEFASKMTKPIETLVIDEAHYIKSRSAIRTIRTRTLSKRADRIWTLSGTPMLNRPIELWPMLNMQKVTDLPYFDFGKRYAAGWKSRWGWDFTGASHLDELRDLLDGYMLRRTKEDVLKDLPPKTLQVVRFEGKAVDGDDPRVLRALLDEKPNTSVLSIEGLAEIVHLIGLMKVDPTVSLAEDILNVEDKVVIFTHHRDVLAAIEKRLKKHNPVVVQGGMSVENKHEAVTRFQNDPECRVFVGNIQAAGTGITLTAARHVVFAETDWVYANIIQAADRCHRIGQRGNVLVQFITKRGSIDEYMLIRALEKQDVVDQVVTATQEGSRSMARPKKNAEQDVARNRPELGQIIVDFKAARAELVEEQKKLVEIEEQFTAQVATVATAIAKVDAAVEKIVGSTEGGAPDEPKAEEPKAEEPKAEEPDDTPFDYSADDVRAKLKEVAAKTDRDTALGLLTKHGDGATNISNLDPSKYGPLMAEAGEILAGK